MHFTVDKYLYGVYNKNTHMGYIGGDKMKNEKTEVKETEIERKCCCCEKTTVRSEDEYKKLINRLNRIEGQIRGIKGMIERNAYCTDILVQSAAVNAAVNSFNKELLASHIRSCVARDIREGKDEVIDELVMTLQKLMK
jgi:DNA-binding FrmR family transcriptional regulator